MVSVGNLTVGGTGKTPVVAWTVETAAGTDLVLLREPGAATDWALPTGQRLSTDAELAIVRLDASQGLIARGTLLELDGVEVLVGVSEAVGVLEP